MKTLEEIVFSLDALKISNEILFKMLDLKQALRELDGEQLDIPDTLLLPFYIQDGKRLELYDYELQLLFVEKKDFEGYLRNLTKRDNIYELPAEIIEKRRNCYIELTEDERDTAIQRIIGWIDFVFSASGLKAELMDYYGEFDIEKLYFEIY